MKASALINAYFVEVSNTQSSVVSMLWDSCSEPTPPMKLKSHVM